MQLQPRVRLRRSLLASSLERRVERLYRVVRVIICMLDKSCEDDGNDNRRMLLMVTIRLYAGL